ncbi:hypothetical protein AC1031_009815 [Aphanomyces cochlioides]|nr:hypothetical protein AC1031_009815 [Aphanomyces cochlioides]
MSTIPTTMKAVGATAALPIEDPSSLLDVVVDVPTVTGHDILVQIKAVSVNPVDYKVRRAPQKPTIPQIIGYDAAGVVVAVGPQTTLFKVDDEVYYAGSIARQGTNSEFHAVDERPTMRLRPTIRKPTPLSFADAASLPLTAITAWEAIFDRLNVPLKAPTPAKKTVLVLNGAGGVGSIAIQVLKKITDVTVIATASKPQSVAWVTELGADHAVNHAQDIPAQLQALDIPQVDYILVFTDLPQHFGAIVDVIKPQGKICAITSNPVDLAFQRLFTKSVTFVWEFMFTRPISVTDDIIEQHRLLNEVRKLVDAKRVRSTVGENLGTINAVNLKKAHAALEAGRVVGKLVLEGF